MAHKKAGGSSKNNCDSNAQSAVASNAQMVSGCLEAVSLCVSWARIFMRVTKSVLVAITRCMHVFLAL